MHLLVGSYFTEFREITMAWNLNLSHCGYFLICAVLVLRFSVSGVSFTCLCKNLHIYIVSVFEVWTFYAAHRHASRSVSQIPCILWNLWFTAVFIRTSSWILYPSQLNPVRISTLPFFKVHFTVTCRRLQLVDSLRLYSLCQWIKLYVQ